MIDVDIMALRFTLNGITPAIGSHGLITDEIDMAFVEGEHLRRQSEACHTVDAFVTIEAPGISGLHQLQGQGHQQGRKHREQQEDLPDHDALLVVSSSTSSPFRSTGIILL